MRVDAFDFELPEDRIALRPARPRDHARMLVVDPEADRLCDRRVRDLAGLLRPGDALVFNDTRVIPAQLAGRRAGRGGARISVTLHKRADAASWFAFARPARRLAVGDALIFSGKDASLAAELVEKGAGGEVLLRFEKAGDTLDAAIAAIGSMPLPPYIAAKRPVDPADRTDYQTVYAEKDGAVAAPTAGLHFTDRVLADLDARGVARHRVTLHVGAGTFLPVKAEDTDDHRMHAEWGRIDAATAAALNRARAAGGRIVAVGTTSLRLLESAAAEDGAIRPFSGETEIFITPGHAFAAVDMLMTNFHLPRSTLFMLVAAFCGLDVMHRAYAHAISEGYRFYSYGDASLLLRSRQG